MTIDVSTNNPRASYSLASGASQSAFTVSFEFFNNEDLNVYVDGTLKTEVTDYTVSGGDGSTGTVTFVSPVVGASDGSLIVITRDIAIERLTDFVAGQDINRAALNEQLDVIVAQIADLNDKASRSLQLNDYELASSVITPDLDTRKGTVLAFNETSGAPQAGPKVSAVISASADSLAAAAAAKAAAASAADAAASAVLADAQTQATIYSIALG